jgi:hypothetical protein
MKALLYIATIVSIFTYFFWEQVKIDYFFYKGNAVFITLLCFYIFNLNRKVWISFLLFSLSLNNLFDELFFDNTKIQLNEILFAIFITIITVVRYAVQEHPRRND